MTVISLFAEPTQARAGPIGWTEPVVHYLTESTKPEAVAARRVLNAAYESFPDPQGQFASRLRSEVNVDHLQALDELITHQHLTRQFRDVRYEEGERAPDFRVYDKGKLVAAVEVLSLFERKDWSEERARHLRLADELNRRIPPTDGYLIDFEIKQADRDPPPARVAAFVRQQIAGLPRHEAAAGSRPGVAVPSAAVYQAPGFHIRFRFFPMRSDTAGKTDPDMRIVLSGPMIGGSINSGERLKKRIKEKAGDRYSIADAPFLVVAGIHDPFYADVQSLWALYGGQSVIFPSGAGIRRNDGLFGADRKRTGGRQRRVSAVAVLQEINVWHPEATDVALFHNPFCVHRWPSHMFPPTRVYGPIEEAADSIRLDWIL